VAQDENVRSVVARHLSGSASSENRARRWAFCRQFLFGHRHEPADRVTDIHYPELYQVDARQPHSLSHALEAVPRLLESRQSNRYLTVAALCVFFRSLNFGLSMESTSMRYLSLAYKFIWNEEIFMCTVLITVSGGFLGEGLWRPSIQDEYFLIHTTIVI